MPGLASGGQSDAAHTSRASTVVGRLDGVPLAGGGQALTIRVVADEVRVGKAEG